MRNPFTKMKIICFRGTGGSGKTTIIMKILKEFFNIGLNQGKKKRDCTISFYHDDKKIGICSYGDTWEQIEAGLKWMEEQDVEIAVIACHPTKTYNKLKTKFLENITFIDCKRVKGSEKDSKERIKIREFKDRFRELNS